ncbi:MAG: phosphoribosylformylglycinamidine synthase subunit PurSL [Patescibacteria group bacterium]|nr:phosphoribosylformylglycinamidine synthase subunit PurSL [Patescibacteria group bacterium]
MISRIYVVPNEQNGKGKILPFNNLGLYGKVANVSVIDSYLVNASLTPEQLNLTGQSLINKKLENYSINSLPNLANFSYILEIGFAPGVTDNVAHTVMESVSDLLKRPFADVEAVYTSKVFLIGGTISKEDVNKIAFSLHNPLIERATIFPVSNELKNKGLPLYVPVVVLPKKKDCIVVPLSNANTDELIKTGKEGILDPDGDRRGPLALDLESMKVIQNFFKNIKRNPTDIELESLAQTWSEHCKHTIFANSIDDIKDGLYKSYIKKATNDIRKAKGKNDFCLSVFSDNAGGIVFDDTYMVSHKVETHNSPSALDPFGGAITGIVGVNRDTIGFGMGAKPIANVYGFCFGYPDDKRELYKDKKLKQKMLPPARIVDGVIKGINAGGNCSGIPTINGFTKFDDRYRGKPLVFAGTIGLSPRIVNGKNATEKRARAGDYIVVVGGKVGLDGVHGATFSSVVLDSSSPATAVQIGDPITQKKLSDAIVKEARDRNLYNSITDNGAGGISCSVAEMAKECGGAVVDIENVPLKYPGLSPWQIWISESQERMTLAVPKNKWDEFQKLMESRGVQASVIGEFSKNKNCVVRHNGKVIMDMPMEFLHNGLPARQLHSKRDVKIFNEPKLPNGYNRTKEFLTLVGSANLGSNRWISEQYDHEVQSSSVVKPLSGAGLINTDAQVIKPVFKSDRAVVVTSSVYPSYGDINTYDMTSCAIDTAVRNAICAGGTLDHLAILDNTCWCSSYDEVRLGELVDAIRACYDTAVDYGTPFISGKDSMFNDFKGYDKDGNSVAISIPPTLLISAIGVMKDFNKAVTPEFKIAGDTIYILGETHDELGASEYYKQIGKNIAIGNSVPKVDTKKNTKIYKALEKVIAKGIVASAISVNSGGLAQALAKASVGGMLGINVDLKKLAGTASSIDAKLFSESQGRIVVSVAKGNVKAFESLIKNIPYTKIGQVKSGKEFLIKNGTQKIVDTKVDTISKFHNSFSNSFK